MELYCKIKRMCHFRNEWIRSTTPASRSNARAPVSDAITIWHSSSFTSRDCEFVLLDARHWLVPAFDEWKSQWGQSTNVFDLKKELKVQRSPFWYTNRAPLWVSHYLQGSVLLISYDHSDFKSNRRLIHTRLLFSRIHNAIRTLVK